MHVCRPSGCQMCPCGEISVLEKPSAPLPECLCPHIVTLPKSHFGFREKEDRGGELLTASKLKPLLERCHSA